MHTSSIFNVINWDESFIYEDKIAKTTANYKIGGDLVGNISAEYLIYYLNYNADDVHESNSRFSGFSEFNGMIDGREGTFMFEEAGSFVEGEYSTVIKIIKGSGTNGFVNISGAGKYFITDDGMKLTLEILL